MQLKLLYFGPSDETKVRIKILDATLLITQIGLKPPLLLAHPEVLRMKDKAHYPVTHTQIKTYTAGSAAQQVSRIYIPWINKKNSYCFG